MREAETDIKFKRKGKTDVSDLSEMKSRKYYCVSYQINQINPFPLLFFLFKINLGRWNSSSHIEVTSNR